MSTGTLRGLKERCTAEIRRLEEQAGAGVASWDEYQRLAGRVLERKRVLGELDEIERKQREDEG